MPLQIGQPLDHDFDEPLGLDRLSSPDQYSSVLVRLADGEYAVDAR
jgi:hypothetical protein